MESKKLAILRILQILLENTDEAHPLTHEEIRRKLDQNYGIEIERKAIGRNIQELIELFDNEPSSTSSGISIVSEKGKGTYVEQRNFEDSELRMLIDAVLSSRYISVEQSRDLINKLCSLSNKYFKSHVKNVYSVNEWGKTNNADLFYNIELIDEAIEKGLRLKFNYNRYEIDKKLHPAFDHEVSPYQLILNNQRYYLMGCNMKFDSITYYRLDRITNMEIIENSRVKDIKTIPGFEYGIDYKDLAISRPYMYNDKAEKVEFVTNYKMLNQLMDWFGDEFEVERYQDKKIKVTLKVSLKAMEYWAMQYLNNIEVIAPLKLREIIKSNINDAQNKYK